MVLKKPETVQEYNFPGFTYEQFSERINLDAFIKLLKASIPWGNIGQFFF